MLPIPLLCGVIDMCGGVKSFDHPANPTFSGIALSLIYHSILRSGRYLYGVNHSTKCLPLQPIGMYMDKVSHEDFPHSERRSQSHVRLYQANPPTSWSVERVGRPWNPSSHLAATHLQSLQACQHPSIQASALRDWSLLS
jgi:hypothetical protein